MFVRGVVLVYYVLLPMFVSFEIYSYVVGVLCRFSAAWGETVASRISPIAAVIVYVCLQCCWKGSKGYLPSFQWSTVLVCLCLEVSCVQC